VPAGSDSSLSLWYVMPCTVYAGGHPTGLFSETSPLFISAVAVMIFIVDPGATAAVRA